MGEDRRWPQTTSPGCPGGWAPEGKAKAQAPTAARQQTYNAAGWPACSTNRKNNSPPR